MNKISTHNKNSRKNGFTLVEILFACAILGFMLTITLTTFVGVFRFYLWSRTTRTAQESARQVLGTISKAIQGNAIVSANNSSLCLNSTQATATEKSLKIFLDTTDNKIKQQAYFAKDCAGSVLGQLTIISASNVDITYLSFTGVSGPGGAVTKSVVVNMQVTNGTPVMVDGTLRCRPSDNFCDQATFTTAAMQR